MLKIKLVPCEESKAVAIVTDTAYEIFLNIDCDFHSYMSPMVASVLIQEQYWLHWKINLNHKRWYRFLKHSKSKGLMNIHRVDGKLTYEIPTYFEKVK